MKLTGRNGAWVEAHIVGYEYPKGDDTWKGDNNWLLVSTKIWTPAGYGESIDPCWQTQEARRIIVWFRAMAEGVPVQKWGGACLERNFEMRVIRESAKSVMLRGYFILEHGGWRPADGSPEISGYGGHVDLTVPRSDLHQAADELESELDRYPPREPEMEMPSPLL